MPEDALQIEQPGSLPSERQEQIDDHIAVLVERLKDAKKREGITREMNHLRRTAEQEGKHPLETEGWELQFVDVPFSDGTRRFVGFAKWEGGKLIRMQHGNNGELLIPQDLYEEAVAVEQGQSGVEAGRDEYMVPLVDRGGMQGVIRFIEAPKEKVERLEKIAQHKPPKASTILSMPHAPLAQKAA